MLLLTGFVADKMGNYKMLLVCSILLGGFIYVPVPWLLHGFEELSAVSQQANDSKPVNESLNNQTETTWSSSVLIHLSSSINHSSLGFYFMGRNE